MLSGADMNRKTLIAAAISLVLTAVAAAWGILVVVNWLLRVSKSLDPTVAAAILAAATTVIVSTLTVMLGRYYERKKDHEAAYRERKTEIYDSFLKELFKIFQSVEGVDKKSEDMAQFLREWQRKMILWGGQGVVSAYGRWISHLKKGEPDAQSVYLMDEFFRAICKDLGHSNALLGKGAFVHFILRDSELFLKASKRDPNIKLSALSDIEKNNQQ